MPTHETRDALVPPTGDRAWCSLPAAGAVLLLTACGSSNAQIAASDVTSCVEMSVRIELPASVEETSGIAVSRAHPGVLWTHNDSGDGPVVYAVDEAGTELGAVSVAGASAIDWEDMEIAECDWGSCLYLGDVGDNPEERASITVYRIPEPSPTDGSSEAAAVFEMTYPDGPRDAEAIFVLPGERLHVVSKGRSDRISVYRHPGPLVSGQSAVLEHLLDLTNEQPSLENQATGASASVNGDFVAIRTYRNLSFHRVVDGVPSVSPVHTQSLRTLNEPQGEAVALGPDGLVVLTSEGAMGNAPAMSLVRCDLRD